MIVNHLRRERLRYEDGAFWKIALASADMSARYDDRDLWPIFGDLTSQREAIRLATKINVGEQQRHAGAMLTQQRKRLNAREGGQNAKAGSQKNILAVHLDNRVVIDYEGVRIGGECHGCQMPADPECSNMDQCTFGICSHRLPMRALRPANCTSRTFRSDGT
jgi:hypothetical protein